MLKVHYRDSLKRNIQCVNEKSTERSMKAFVGKAGKKAGDMFRGSIWSFK